MLNITVDELIKLSENPALFTPGERLFWNAPHISKQMLAAHLDPNTDRASYRPETIEKIVDFTTKYLKLQQGDIILDAGCGPGLYCERFANAGFCVTGIDFSENSIKYAKESAEFYYPEDTTYLYQCIVATNNSTKVYRIYQTHYTNESISELLVSHGFRIVDIFEDLTGYEYNARSKRLGVIAQK